VDDTTHVGEDWSAGVRGAAVIVVEDATEDVAALDRASVLGLSVGDGATLVDALMRACNVVITVDELTQHPPEMGFIENEKMVEAFFSDGTDPSFGEGIGIGSLKGCGENMEAFADENGIESIRVLAIVVPDEKSQRGLGIVDVPQDLSGLLRDPGPGGVGRDARQVYTPSSNLDEEEHIQGMEGNRFNGEEIALASRRIKLSSA